MLQFQGATRKTFHSIYSLGTTYSAFTETVKWRHLRSNMYCNFPFIHWIYPQFQRSARASPSWADQVKSQKPFTHLHTIWTSYSTTNAVFFGMWKKTREPGENLRRLRQNTHNNIILFCSDGPLRCVISFSSRFDNTKDNTKQQPTTYVNAN